MVPKSSPKPSPAAIKTRAELAGEEFGRMIEALDDLLKGAHHPTSTAVGQDLTPLARSILRFGKLVSYDAEREEQFDGLLSALDVRATRK